MAIAFHAVIVTEDTLMPEKRLLQAISPASCRLEARSLRISASAVRDDGLAAFTISNAIALEMKQSRRQAAHTAERLSVSGRPNLST